MKRKYPNIGEEVRSASSEPLGIGLSARGELPEPAAKGI